MASFKMEVEGKVGADGFSLKFPFMAPQLAGTAVGASERATKSKKKADLMRKMQAVLNAFRLELAQDPSLADEMVRGCEWGA